MKVNRVKVRGVKLYELRVTWGPAGNRRSKRPRFETLKAANRAMRQIEAARANGTMADLMAELMHETADGETWAELVASFLKNYKGKRGRKLSEYYRETLVGRDPDKPSKALALALGNVKVADLEEDHSILARYRDERLNTASPSTVKKELIAVGVVFGWAIERNRATSNPAKKIARPAEPKPKEPAELTRDQIADTLAELELADPWAAPVFRFIVGTGCRLQEALIERAAIDRAAGAVTLNRGKTDRRETIPLGEVARQALDHAADRDKIRDLDALPSAQVFRDERGRPLYDPDRPQDRRGRNRLSQRIAAAMRRAGIDASVKATRSTVGSLLAQRGHPEFLVGRLLGHSWASSTTTGKYYVSTNVESLRPLVAAIDSWFMCQECAKSGSDEETASGADAAKVLSFGG
jgi:site-specific recombinase XerD